MTEQRRVNAKEAAASAAEYYESVTNDHAGVLIEEVEYDVENDKWKITLSHRDPATNYNVFGQEPSRKYKSFIVNAVNGDVEAMKIRTV